MMSDAPDESVSKRTINFAVNDALTRSIMLKCAIISIYGVARGWDSVTAYKKEMNFSYFCLRYFGFLSMYVYVLKLVCCFGHSDPPYTTFKGRPILLAIMSLMVSVTMFYNCYTWQRWDVYFLTLSVIIATVSLAQLIYGVDGLTPGCVGCIAIFGSAWGINGLYFDITSGSTICTFPIIAIFQMAFTSVIYIDDSKPEEEIAASFKISMSDASDESVSKRTIILGVNDAFTRLIMLKYAIISIYGVARGWDSVIAYKEEMNFSYFLLRYFGFLSMYVYVLNLVCYFGHSDPPHTTFKGRQILLAIMSLMVSVSMFCNCYTWQRWDVFFLTLSVIIATISLTQLIYGVDGLGAGSVLWIAILGSAWGINGLYFDITSGLTICIFFIVTIFQIAFTSEIYNDETKLSEKKLLASIKDDFQKLHYY